MTGSRHARVALLTFALIGVGTVARSETLPEALVTAYETNPSLQAQRATLKALDENYAQAYAGTGPTASIQAQTDQHAGRLDSLDFQGTVTTSTVHGFTNSESLSVTQPIYTGGRATAHLSGAQADVLAGRQQLRAAEQQLLQNVVIAYMDVRRDQQLLTLGRNNIDLLRRELSDAQTRASLREVTLTDVAQAKVRLAGGEAQLSSAQGRLAVSRAAYLNLVGHNPGELAPEPILTRLPATLEDAFDTLDTRNPSVLAADFAEQGSRARVAEARAANAPTISLRADLARAPLAPYLPRLYENAFDVAAVLQTPLFTAGLNASQIRQALDRAERDRASLEAARRDALQAAAQAWDQLVTARTALNPVIEEVRQGKVAYEGARIEEGVGLRTTLDVLNAELELQNAQSTLIALVHDEYVAQTALLVATGAFEIDALAPGAVPYDPLIAFRRVAHSGSAPWQGAVFLIDGVGAPRDAKLPGSRRGPAPERADDRATPLPPRPSVPPDLLKSPNLEIPPEAGDARKR